MDDVVSRRAAAGRVAPRAAGPRAPGGRFRKGAPGGWIVSTPKGEIACEIVVNAAGYYAGEVGKWFGREVPMAVMSHQYLLFDEMPEVVAWAREQRVDETDDRAACKDWVQRLGAAGWLRYCVPAAHGGALPVVARVAAATSSKAWSIASSGASSRRARRWRPRSGRRSSRCAGWPSAKTRPWCSFGWPMTWRGRGSGSSVTGGSTSNSSP